LNMERVEGGPAVAAGSSRITGRRSAAVAATLLATVGVWAIALWLWLDGGSLKEPVSDLVGTRMPSVSATADRPPAAQPPPVTTKTAERDAQAPAQQLAPPDGNAADQVIQVPSTVEQRPASRISVNKGGHPAVRTTVPEISPAVVRGTQPSAAPEVASDSNMAVFRGKQAPEAAQSAPDSGPAVVRGTRAPAEPSSP
jgi:hypothetical protein